MAETLRRIVGVYHADGGVWGELRYSAGKALGTAHCALCDISHSGIRKKADFAACQAEQPVPFEVVHLNERDAAVCAATEDRTPCVVAETDAGVTMLLSAVELEALAGDVARFREALQAALAKAGLSEP